jgi:hypothetical protein
MKMIFNALSGSSGQVPVTTIDRNRMSMEIACVLRRLPEWEAALSLSNGESWFKADTIYRKMVPAIPL